jgi:hypothetical protein
MLRRWSASLITEIALEASFEELVRSDYVRGAIKLSAALAGIS